MQISFTYSYQTLYKCECYFVSVSSYTNEIFSFCTIGKINLFENYLEKKKRPSKTKKAQRIKHTQFQYIGIYFIYTVNIL